MADFYWLSLASIEFFAIVLLWSVYFEKSKHPKLYFALLFILASALLNQNFIQFDRLLNGTFSWIFQPVLNWVGFN